MESWSILKQCEMDALKELLRNGYGGQAKVTKVLSVLQTENAEGRGPQSKIANRKSKI
jgi:hypothetical protein